jgi:type I restriction enzyme S subunit
MALRVDPSRVDADFVYYSLRSPALQRQIRDSAIVTGVPHINLGIFGDFMLLRPPLAEQQAISSILRTLDGKIDGYRRQVTLIEDVAATVFRARFVDCIGVEVFEENELGRMPVGWQWGSLPDLARFVNGGAFTKDANGRGRPILRIKELNGGIGDETLHTDIEVVDDRLARDNDILFAWSGSLAAYRWSGPESVINQHIFKVIPDGWPLWFVYGWLQEHMSDFRAIARDKATTMGHIQRHHLSEAVVPLPDAEAIANADDVLDSLDGHRAMLVREAATLGEIRDALLPKLISGEIRVPDTTDPEEVIGPAAEALVEAGS